MTKQFHWETDYELALSEARGVNKPLLIDFFNPD